MDLPSEQKVQGLGDLELAILLSLVAQQHCIVTTAKELQANIPQELRLICQEAFNLQPAIVQCSSKTTVDEFNEAILVEAGDDFEDVEDTADGFGDSTFSAEGSPKRHRGLARLQSNLGNTLDERRIADVIIAANLDLASQNVQVQVLELLRTGRIFTRTSMHTASKDGLLIVVLSNPTARLFKHLNDMIAMAHHHELDHGLPRLDGMFDEYLLRLRFTKLEVNRLRRLSGEAHITGEVAEYLHNIVVFMRLNRLVKGGVTAAATRHFRALASALAPLHGLDYVTPSLVALAARKVYPHRLVLATPQNERSLGWGSDPVAVKNVLKGVTIEDAIENTISSVETPL